MRCLWNGSWFANLLGIALSFKARREGCTKAMRDAFDCPNTRQLKPQTCDLNLPLGKEVALEARKLATQGAADPLGTIKGALIGPCGFRFVRVF
jgi:hypothetical protein